LLLGLLAWCAAPVVAQQPAGAGTGITSLPDSPQPKTMTAANPITGTTTRFVGYATNRSIFFPDIATSPGPLTTGGKFKLFVDQSVSPAYVLGATIDAATGQARDVPPGYGQGWDAYGERFGALMGRASSNSFFCTFVFASALRQDPRFFPQSHPTFWGSIKYSVQRLFVIRADSGRDVFNSSGVFGTLAGETLANAYLPHAEQTGAKTAQRFGTDLGWRFAANMFKNYWPTFFRGMGLNRLKVIPDPGSPDQRACQPKQ
jgi:hypothetical protein